MNEFLDDFDDDCEVITAKSGEEALERIEEKKPDIVILDTVFSPTEQMMNGFDACRKIKDKWADDIVIIMLTGKIDAVDTRKARESGADDYCVKTSTWNLLKDALDRQFNQK